MKWGPLVVAGFCLALPGEAGAANGLRPRTPALFENAPCVMTVDKSVEPVLHIDYSVPFDDTELTPEELPDSRTQQFFAISKVRFDYALPVWITQADYDRAEQNGDITKMFTDEDIFELSTEWPASTWVRITPDDPRLPITLEQAAMGVDWDLADVPAGTWVIAAYTWEPENNLWSYRFGAVRLLDPANPDSGGPAAFLEPAPDAIAMVGEPLAVKGCVAAAEGSTFTASYGILEGLDEPAWVPFIEDEPTVEGELRFDFTPPEEAAGGKLKVRVEVIDPEGRTYVAFSPNPVEVMASPSGGTDGGEDTSDTSDPTDTSESETSDLEGFSAGCTLGDRRRSYGALALLVIALGMTKRRGPRARGS